MPSYARAMDNLGTETAFEVLARAKQLEATGKSIVHLEIGEPDFDTPRNIIEAAKKALDEGFTHYGPAAGLPALREAVAELVARDRGIDVKPDNVVITPGGKPIMFYMMLAVLDPEAEALYPNPGFPIYESVIRYLGARPVPLALRQKNEFRLDLDEVRDRLNERTRLLIMNTPQNPTGGALPPEDIRALAEMLQDYPDVWVLSDEIYSQLLYEGRHASIAAEPGMLSRTVILDGFSKTYAMTGWRLGYGVMPVPLAEKISRLATNCNSCTASFIQMAGVEALRGPQDDARAMRDEFHKRGRLITDGLNKIDGITCVQPRGAFYVFPDITGLGVPSKEVERSLLEEFGVAALSGTAFGAHGEGHVRFSYANSTRNLQIALERVGDYARSVQKGS